MSVSDIIHRIAVESGRDDLDLDGEPITALGWINDYKLALQRDKRYTFSFHTADLNVLENNRITALPDDYLTLVTIRRTQRGLTGITQDLFGNRFTVTKEVVLHPWVDQELFADRFPEFIEDGIQNVAAFNNFMLQGLSVIWGPTPIEDEILKIDYYRLLPKYNLTDNTNDAFITYYEDGLFYRGMEMVFTSWIPDEKKKRTWGLERKDAEGGLKKYQVNRDALMHTTMNLPDL